MTNKTDTKSYELPDFSSKLKDDEPIFCPHCGEVIPIVAQLMMECDERKAHEETLEKQIRSLGHEPIKSSSLFPDNEKIIKEIEQTVSTEKVISLSHSDYQFSDNDTELIGDGCTKDFASYSLNDSFDDDGNTKETFDKAIVFDDETTQNDKHKNVASDNIRNDIKYVSQDEETKNRETCDMKFKIGGSTVFLELPKQVRPF